MKTGNTDKEAYEPNSIRNMQLDTPSENLKPRMQ